MFAKKAREGPNAEDKAERLMAATGHHLGDNGHLPSFKLLYRAHVDCMLMLVRFCSRAEFHGYRSQLCPRLVFSQRVVLRSVMKRDADIRESLYTIVVLSGGTNISFQSVMKRGAVHLVNAALSEAQP